MNRIRSLYLTALAILLSPIGVQATVISYNGMDYDASTVTGSSTQVLSTLEHQPWWGDDSDATGALVIQAWELFGPVIFEDYGNPIGPLVATSDTREFIYVSGCSAYEPVPDTGCIPLGYAIPTDQDRPEGSRAVATYLVALGAIAVPEPATLALFGLGLIGIALARRKKA